MIMKKYILISLISILSIYHFSYADISNSAKQQIEIKVDSVIEKIENRVSQMDSFNKKNDYLNILLSRLNRLQDRYGDRSDSYEYLFRYLSIQLNKVYIDLHNQPIDDASNYYWSWLSQSQIKNIVNIHNQYRSEVWVGDLTWSDMVAKSAEKWWKVLQEDSCGFYHSDFKQRSWYGENLYIFWTSNPNFSWDNSTGAMRWFGEEKHDYDYEANTCAKWKICGHYTQMVWSDTTEVWCARVSCNQNGYKEIYVCHYNPTGNYIWEKPY